MTKKLLCSPTTCWAKYLSICLFSLPYPPASLPSYTLGGSKGSPSFCHLLLSPSCSVMFLLNWMLLLQPLLEPNGEKGSENHTHHEHLVYYYIFRSHVQMYIVCPEKVIPSPAEVCVNSCVCFLSCSTRPRAAWQIVSPEGVLGVGKRSA